jgi:hypothetical protein
MSTARKTALAVALVSAAGGLLSLPACESVPLTAAPGTSMTLIANPTFVPANGGRALLTAILVEPAGTFVPDGTKVFFFSNLGRVDPDEAKTVDGVARTTFVADARSGVATITAISGGPAPAPAASPGTGATATGDGSATVEVSVGGALPRRLIVAASPARITQPRRATIVANVFDQFGNPVQNVPVVFTIKSATPVLEETLDSGGAPSYSDSNGQAFDTLVTRAPVGLGQKTVVVSASAPPDLTADVTVFID